MNKFKVKSDRIVLSGHPRVLLAGIHDVEELFDAPAAQRERIFIAAGEVKS